MSGCDAAFILKLPVELIEPIAVQLSTDDLFATTLASEELDSKTSLYIAKRYFTERSSLRHRSMVNSISIALHPLYRILMRKIYLDVATLATSAKTDY